MHSNINVFANRYTLKVKLWFLDEVTSALIVDIIPHRCDLMLALQKRGLPMKMSIVAVICSLTAGSVAASDGLEGRWIKPCGEDTWCRLYVERIDEDTIQMSFAHTRPSTQGTIVDEGNQPDPEICSWSETLSVQQNIARSANGMSAEIGQSGLLLLSGISEDCEQPGREATFERDEVDEINDI